MSDIAFELYYCIPWPESQRYEDMDDLGEHCHQTSDGLLFADKKWIDGIEGEQPIDLDIESWIE